MTEREDLWLGTLAEHAREEIEGQDLERFNARWDDYSAGRLSGAEVAALTEAGEDPETQLAMSLFKPLGGDFKASLVERLQQETRAQAVSVQDTRSEDVLPGKSAPNDTVPRDDLRESEARTDPETPESERGGLTRLSAWLGGFEPPRKLGLGLAAGVMAALLMVLGLPLTWQELEALPPFESKLQGIQQQRSAADGPREIFRAGHRFDFRLRPDQKVEGPIVTTVVVQDPNGGSQRWKDAEAAVKRSEDGAVFTDGLTWPWGEGDWTVHFFLTREPLQDDHLRDLLLGRSPDAVTLGLGDGHWLQERIYVEP